MNDLQSFRKRRALNYEITFACTQAGQLYVEVSENKTDRPAGVSGAGKHHAQVIV